MNINTMFPSKYVAAADLNGMDVPVEIARIAPETMPEGENRPVVYFAGLSISADYIAGQIGEYYSANKLPRLTEVKS